MSNKNTFFFCSIFFFSFVFFNKAYSQSFFEKSHIGIGFGGMKYSGNIWNPYTKFAIQGNYTYELTDHFNVRGQVFLGSIGASDASAPIYTPDNALYNRPHPFNSRIQELSLLLEYNLWNMNDDHKWTPYIFAGIGMFHFNPYYTSYDATANRFYNYKYYATDKRNKINIPYGLGIKYGITDNIRLSLEANIRYTTTNDLDGYNVPKERNDFYYSGTVGISFRLGGDYHGNNGGKNSRYNTKNCPPVYN